MAQKSLKNVQYEQIGNVRDGFFVQQCEAFFFTKKDYHVRILTIFSEIYRNILWFLKYICRNIILKAY